MEATRGLFLEFYLGTTIQAAAKIAVEEAARLRQPVVFQFNGRYFKADPISRDVERIVQTYQQGGK